MGDQANALFSNFLRKKRIETARPYISGKVLDFGCGVGEMANICKPENYWGVDTDSASIEIAKTKHPQFHFSTEFPETEKFDTIILLAVIEHILEPVELLKILKKMLTPSGTIILTTPHPSFQYIHTLGSKLGLLSKEALEEHKLLLNYKTMQNITKKSGLTINKYKRFLFGANQLFVLKSS